MKRIFLFRLDFPIQSQHVYVKSASVGAAQAFLERIYIAAKVIWISDTFGPADFEV
jgi:hypothetical protein